MSERNAIGTYLSLLGVMSLLLVPSEARGYVDPGILGQLYQLWYVIVFGVLAAFVAKPYRSLQALAYKLAGRSRADEEAEKEETQRGS